MTDLLSIGKKKKRSRGPELSETIEADDTTLVYTQAAKEKIHQMFARPELNAQGQDADVLFRIAIKAGGCSGLEYDFLFTKRSIEGDTILSEDLPKIAVDPKSMKVLAGCILDVQKGIGSEKFIVVNPKAKTACSCGSSFSL